MKKSVWVRHLFTVTFLTSMMSVNMSAVSADGVVRGNKTVSSEQSELLIKQENFFQVSDNAFFFVNGLGMQFQVLDMLIMTPILLSMKPVQLPSIDGDSVQVTRSPSFTLTIGADHTISIDNQIVANEAALQQKLKEIAACSDQPVLYIKADKMTKYKTIAPILADARRLGITKIAFQGKK